MVNVSSLSKILTVGMTFLQGTEMTDKVSALQELRVWDKETTFTVPDTDPL